jgi:hypothetical protein
MVVSLRWSTVSAASDFLGAQKVTKNALKPMVSVFLHSSRFLVGRRHPWPSVWQQSYGFRCRPLFYIPVKKRRQSPSLEPGCKPNYISFKKKNAKPDKF